MPISIASIHRSPVKSLTPESLDRVPVTPGEGLPNDRRFAIARETAVIDSENPQFQRKANFVVLAQVEKLATLRTTFDDASGTLIVERDGKAVLTAKITEPIGRTLADQFFDAYLGEAKGSGKIRMVDGATLGEGAARMAGKHRFFDVPDTGMTAISLASIRDLERVMGRTLDPMRFRANLYLDGATAWQEFDWVGREIAVGGVRMKVTGRVDRCAATNVDPSSGARDLNIPRALRQAFDHIDLGVYLEALVDGEIAVGDRSDVPEGVRQDIGI